MGNQERDKLNNDLQGLRLLVAIKFFGPTLLEKCYWQRVFPPVLLCLLFIFAAWPTWAQDKKDKEDLYRGQGAKQVIIPIEGKEERDLYDESHALLIGVSKFRSGWKSLPGVEQDMDAISKVLTAHGFKVHPLPNPTKEVFEKELPKFLAQYALKPKNRILVYFAGHGYSLPGVDEKDSVGYIVLSDTPPPRSDKPEDNVEFLASAIPITRFRDYADQIRSKHAFFLFDSCFSGTLVSGGRRAAPPSITAKTENWVRQFLTAGAAKEEVPDDSLFRKLFVAGLEGSADRSPADGYVTGSELIDYITDGVTDWARQKGQIQNPLSSRIDNPTTPRGDIIFALPSSLRKGEVTVTAQPGATVSLYRSKDQTLYKKQDIKPGQSALFQEVEVGDYQVVTTLDGYQRREAAVEIRVRDPKKSLDLSLARNEFTLTILTNVRATTQDAKVCYPVPGATGNHCENLINGQALIKLPVGTTKLDIIAKGYKTVSDIVTLPGESNKRYDMVLDSPPPTNSSPTVGTLTVVSEENAIIKVYTQDNKHVDTKITDRGTGQAKFPNLSFQKYHVAAELKGYVSNELPLVELNADNLTPVATLRLTPLTYSLVIETNVESGTISYTKPRAQVETQQKFSAKSFSLSELPEGKYKLTLDGGAGYSPEPREFILPGTELLRIFLKERVSTGAFAAELMEENHRQWSKLPTDWQLSSETLHINGAGQLLLNESSFRDFKDFVLSVRFSLANDRGATLIFRAQNAQNYYQVRINGGGAASDRWKCNVESIEQGIPRRLGQFPLTKNGWKPTDNLSISIMAKDNIFDFTIKNESEGKSVGDGRAFDKNKAFSVGAVGLAALDKDENVISFFHVCNKDDCKM